MKKAVRFILVVFVLAMGAAAAQANCWYPKSRHIEYWQHHSYCVWDANLHRWACEDWWQVDGTCDVDCDGNMTCDGDTTVRSDTIVDTTLQSCPPVCE
jgi:hypothetical protein